MDSLSVMVIKHGMNSQAWDPGLSYGGFGTFIYHFIFTQSHRKQPRNAALLGEDEDVDTDNDDQGLCYNEDEDKDDLCDNEYVDKEEGENGLDNNEEGNEAGEYEMWVVTWRRVTLGELMCSHHIAL